MTQMTAAGLRAYVVVEDATGAAQVSYVWTPVHRRELHQEQVVVVDGITVDQARVIAQAIDHGYAHGKEVGRRWTAEHMAVATMNSYRMLAGMSVEPNAGGLEEA